MDEHEKAKECMDFLKNYCKADGSNCTSKCPFAYEDYTIHCNLGSKTQMYPGDWKDAYEDWSK